MTVLKPVGGDFMLSIKNILKTKTLCLAICVTLFSAICCVVAVHMVYSHDLLIGYEYRVIVKAIAFVSWCVLYILIAVTSFVARYGKHEKGTAFTYSFIAALSSLLTVFAINTYSYLLCYNSYYEDKKTYIEYIFDELDYMYRFHGAFIVTFALTMICITWIENNGLKKLYDGTENVKINTFETLKFLGNVLVESENASPFIIAIADDENKNINVILTSYHSDELENLLQYTMTAVAQVRKRNDTDYAETLDDFELLSKKAISIAYECDEKEGD